MILLRLFACGDCGIGLKNRIERISPTPVLMHITNQPQPERVA
jgi:hypothetical protein